MSDRMTLERAVQVADDTINCTGGLYTYGEWKQAIKILIAYARKDLPAPKEEEQLEGQMNISDYGI